MLQLRDSYVEELRVEIQTKDESIASKDTLIMMKDDLITTMERDIATKEALLQVASYLIR